MIRKAVFNPAAGGFSADGLRASLRILQEGVERQLYPGAVVWVSRRGEDTLVASVGVTQPGGNTPVDENTLFDLASLTKPVATATAILLLAQEGHIHLGMPVTDFFPQRNLPHLESVSLRHLLTHTSGLPAWNDLISNGQDRERAIDDLFNISLINVPGAAHVYSCLGYIMLGLVVEAVTGESLQVFCRNRIFEPLNMRDTDYLPDPSDRVIAATANCPLRKAMLIGEVHDGNAYVLGGVSGNAGLFSTASDLAKFCHSVTRNRSADHNMPLNVPVIETMFVNAIPESVGGQTLGWFIFPNDMLPGGDFVSKAAIGHSGFTGTAIIIDPKYAMFAIMLTNRVCKDDDGLAFRSLRRRFYNTIVGAIVC